MKNELNKVLEFHRVFQCYTNTLPVAEIPENQRVIRARLMQEELDEYCQAAAAGDLEGVADALSDLLYVVLGTYIAHGLQDAAEPLFAEVHRSNMSKLDENGQPIFRADGKVLKSHLFDQPRLKPILERCAQG